MKTNVTKKYDKDVASGGTITRTFRQTFDIPFNAMPIAILIGVIAIVMALAAAAQCLTSLAAPAAAQLLRRDELIGRLRVHEDVEGVPPRIEITQTDGETTYAAPLIAVPATAIRQIPSAIAAKYQVLGIRSVDRKTSFLIDFGLFEKATSLKVNSALLFPASRLPLAHHTTDRRGVGYLNMNFFSLTDAQLRAGAKVGLKVKIQTSQGGLALAVPTGHVKALLAALP